MVHLINRNKGDYCSNQCILYTTAKFENRWSVQAYARAGHCGAKRLELRTQPFEVGRWSHLLESLYHCIPVALYLFLSCRHSSLRSSVICDWNLKVSTCLASISWCKHLFEVSIFRRLLGSLVNRVRLIGSRCSVSRCRTLVRSVPAGSSLASASCFPLLLPSV